jgi:hypothetical protein
MSHSLSKWNTIIFLGQMLLLAVVTGMTYLTQASAQKAVLVGLGSIVVLTILNASGAMRQEREVVYDLSIGNACGIVAALCFTLATMHYGTVPTNVFTGCFFGGVLFLGISIAMAIFAARSARALGVRQPMLALVVAAAPLGIGPLFGRRVGMSPAAY